MGHDVVLDISGIGQMLGTDASVPVVTPPIRRTRLPRTSTLLTAFPLAQSVSGQASANPNEAVQNLLQTSERSWSESDVKSLMAGGKVSFDEASGDHKGPITIGLTLSEDAKEVGGTPARRLRAARPASRRRGSSSIGDSDFASNAAVGMQGNSDLFVNINNWLTQQEDLISIHPRAKTTAGFRSRPTSSAASHGCRCCSAGAHSGIRRLRLAAEPVGVLMRGFRSTIILLVAALGFGAYLYFIDAKKPVADENAKQKVFAVDAVEHRSASR